MATYTTNYSLKKPDQEDMFDITDSNQNMDLLDTQLFALAQNLATTATESTLASLMNIIGTTANTGGTISTGTTMAKLNAVLSSFSTNIGTTSNTGGSSTAGTAMAKLNAILSALATQPKGTVKKIQRGFTTSSTISISAVDPSKCMVILNNSISAVKDYSTTLSATLKSIEETSFTITNNGYSNAQSYVSWQLIEFY